ncbi:MAG: lipopolysaccharide biosynthesis protein, partial [Candidatus Kapaibacterium sp.]
VRTIIESGYEIHIARESAANHSNIHNLLRESSEIKNALFMVLLIPAIALGWLMSGSFVFVALLIWIYIWSACSGMKSALRGIGRMRSIAAVESRWSFALYAINFLLLFWLPNLLLIFAAFALAEFFKAVDYHKKLSGWAEIPSLYRLYQIKFSIFSKIKSNLAKLRAQFRLVAVNFLSVLHYRAPMIMLGLVSTSAAIGLYSAGLRFLTALRLIPGASLNVLLPEFSTAGSSRRDLRSGMLFAVITGLVVSAGLWSGADFIMSITFDFGEAVPVLRVLAWTFLPVSVNHICEAWLLSGRRESGVNRALASTSALILISAAISIPLGGAIAAAWCALGGETALMLIYFVMISKIKN